MIIRTTTLIITGIMLTAVPLSLCYSEEQINIVLNGDDQGREYEGWGALSAGATSVFLRDYPEPYRSDILDYLFKPKFGLNIQHLKVEIGSGVDSTCGAEPSHVITPDELDNPVPRGYELWLAAEARKRNPAIILDALPWGTPYWTKDYTTKEAADWTVAFLDVAKEHYGLDFQYIGGSQNELLMMKGEDAFGAPFEFVKKYLRPALDAAGYEDVQIQMADHYNERHNGKFRWETTRKIMADPELNKIVPVIGYHYPVGYKRYYVDSRPMPEGFLESGKRHWASEDYSERGDKYSNIHNYLRKIIREYDELRMTKSIAWAPFSSLPKGFSWDDVGFLDASDSWSGHYSPRSIMWCMAQLTQFFEPGWVYMDSTVKSCGKDEKGSMYMAMRSPDGRHWSLLVVTGTEPASLRVQIDKDMRRKRVHVWRSDANEQMIQLDRIKTKKGAFDLSLAPSTIYTFTSTTGQTKGEPPHPIPPAIPGGPWKDDLKNYRVHDRVKYWGDLEGTFEIAEYEGENVMMQVVPEPGCEWHKGLHGECIALYGGCDAVADFILKADVRISDGHVWLGGRRDKKEFLGFRLNKNGEWSSAQTGKSGRLDNFDSDAWHKMEFEVSGDAVIGLIDGKEIFNAEAGDGKPMTISLASSYDPNMFTNIEVIPGIPTDQKTTGDEVPNPLEP